MYVVDGGVRKLLALRYLQSSVCRVTHEIVFSSITFRCSIYGGSAIVATTNVRIQYDWCSPPESSTSTRSHDPESPYSDRTTDSIESCSVSSSFDRICRRHHPSLHRRKVSASVLPTEDCVGTPNGGSLSLFVRSSTTSESVEALLKPPPNVDEDVRVVAIFCCCWCCCPKSFMDDGRIPQPWSTSGKRERRE
jgi:hypothetical protein